MRLSYFSINITKKEKSLLTHSIREVTEQTWPFYTSDKAVTKLKPQAWIINFAAYTAIIIAQNHLHHPQ